MGRADPRALPRIEAALAALYAYADALIAPPAARTAR